MPLYNPDHLEYEVTSGNIQIAMEDGGMLPAYWAHPSMGAKFPGIVLIHDWWGVTPVVRRLAMQLAQTGYYVIVPDLYNGKLAETHSEALALFEALGESGYKRADTALSVLEHHHNCNGDVAAVGLGMGGSLSFEAALVRKDLEAAVAFGGFPQRYLGHFAQAHIPILAIYGSEDEFVPRTVIEQLREELAAHSQTHHHQVIVLEGARHEIFDDDLTPAQEKLSVDAWTRTLDFIDDYLQGPNNPPGGKPY